MFFFFLFYTFWTPLILHVSSIRQIKVLPSRDLSDERQEHTEKNIVFTSHKPHDNKWMGSYIHNNQEDGYRRWYIYLCFWNFNRNAIQQYFYTRPTTNVTLEKKTFFFFKWKKIEIPRDTRLKSRLIHDVIHSFFLTLLECIQISKILRI